MREVRITELPEIARLSKPVVGPNGRVLLEPGTLLTPIRVQLLQRARVATVWIEEDSAPAYAAAPPPGRTVRAAATVTSAAPVARAHRFAGVLGEPLMQEIASAAGELAGHRFVDAAPTSPCDLRPGGGSAGPAAPTKVSALSLRAQVAQILADPARFPTVPTIYQRLTQVIQDPEATIGDVSEVVASDPVSASRLLQLVNSPFYGMPRRVTTVTAGVQLLGFDAVRSLVLAITAAGMFKAPPGTPPQVAQQLWFHSLGCGLAAGIIARRLGQPDPEQFFVAGLLHDIGKIVLLRCAPEAFQAVCDAASAEGTLFVAAENKVCGTTHAQLGALLADHWRFPPALVEAVSLHHRPELAKAQPALSAVVHLADILVRALSIGFGGDDLVPPLHASARSLLALDRDRLRAMMADIETAYPDLEALLSEA